LVVSTDCLCSMQCYWLVYQYTGKYSVIFHNKFAHLALITHVVLRCHRTTYIGLHTNKHYCLQIGELSDMLLGVKIWFTGGKGVKLIFKQVYIEFLCSVLRQPTVRFCLGVLEHFISRFVFRLLYSWSIHVSQQILLVFG